MQSRNSLLFQVANEVILRFDEAMETRQLSPDERKLRSFLKGRCLALASLERVSVLASVICKKATPTPNTST
jgi:hypothetical protein